MKLLRSLLIILAFTSFPLVTLADQASSTSFRIESGVIDAGGSLATSSGFNLRSSEGQPGTGISSSTSFKIRGGFLNFPLPAAPATTTPPGGGPIIIGAGGPARIISIPIVAGRCDFNDDSRCNIVDLSIMLFHYERSGGAIARYDLNSDGRVNFPDLSVLMYYWTG